jgi:hypothetical protein
MGRGRSTSSPGPYAVQAPEQRLLGGEVHAVGFPVGHSCMRFADAEKIRSMFRRFAARRMAEDVAAFDYGIQHGSGAVELRLGDEQLAALKEQKLRR